MKLQTTILFLAALLATSVCFRASARTALFEGRPPRDASIEEIEQWRADTRGERLSWFDDFRGKGNKELLHFMK